MRTLVPTLPIPHYALFGELPNVDPGAPLHVEPIRRRSRPRGWDISDHAHDSLLQMVIVQRGGVAFSVDGHTSHERGPVIICVPPGVVHAFRFDPRVTGDVVSIGNASALSPLVTPMQLAPSILKPGVRALRPLAPLLELSRAETDANRPGRALMLEWLARCMLLWLSRLREAGRGLALSQDVATSQALRFRHLVERHYRTQRQVGFYAKALGLTERSLQRLCRESVGLSPGRLIEERVSLEARRRLLYTHDPVAVIGFDLGFDDPAYFSRFVRRHSGAAPSELRRSGQRATTDLGKPAAARRPHRRKRLRSSR